MTSRSNIWLVKVSLSPNPLPHQSSCITESFPKRMQQILQLINRYRMISKYSSEPLVILRYSREMQMCESFIIPLDDDDIKLSNDDLYDLVHVKYSVESSTWQCRGWKLGYLSYESAKDVSESEVMQRDSHSNVFVKIIVYEDETLENRFPTKDITSYFLVTYQKSKYSRYKISSKQRKHINSSKAIIPNMEPTTKLLYDVPIFMGINCILLKPHCWMSHYSMLIYYRHVHLQMPRIRVDLMTLNILQPQMIPLKTMKVTMTETMKMRHSQRYQMFHRQQLHQTHQRQPIDKT